MNYEELKRLDHTYLWHPFTQMKRVDGRGAVYHQPKATAIISSMYRVGSIWTEFHRFGAMFMDIEKELDEAVKAQLDRLAHSTFLGLSHPPGIQLAQKLIEIAPKGMQRVFYSDSGATAVEIALKMAVQYWQLKGEAKRTQVASLAESYHGDTVGAMSVGYSEIFHRFHLPLLFPVLRINPPHGFRYLKRLSEEEALKSAIREAEEKLTQKGLACGAHR